MLDFGPFLPLNISMICSVLKEAGYEVELFDTTFYRNPKPEDLDDIMVEIGTFKPVNWDGYRMDDLRDDPVSDFKQKVKQFKPDFIGLSIFTTFNAKFSLSLIDAIDDDFQGKVIVGGMHTFVKLDEIQKNSKISAVINGECEDVLISALEFLSESNSNEVCTIPNFHYRNLSGEWSTSHKTAISNVEYMPFVNWDFFDDRNFYRPFDGKILRIGHVEIARGCPFRCTYCINEYFHKEYPNSKPYQHEETQGYWRLKSVERFLEEISYLKNRYKLEAIKIWDDDFLAMNVKTLTGVSTGLKKMGLKFLCHSRPEHVSVEKVKIIADGGCIQIGIGVESGNPKYRREMLGRSMTDDQIVTAFKNCRDYGIISSAYCMIGMPDETREDILMTAQLLRKANPHVIVHAIFTPYPGNTLYDYAQGKGYIDQNINFEDYLKCFLNMPSISTKEVEELFRSFHFYCRLDDEYYPEIQKGQNNLKNLERLVPLIQNVNA